MRLGMVLSEWMGVWVLASGEELREMSVGVCVCVRLCVLAYMCVCVSVYVCV